MHGDSFQRKLALLTNKGKPLVDVNASPYLVTFLKNQPLDFCLDVLSFFLRNQKGESLRTAAGPVFQTKLSRGPEV